MFSRYVLLSVIILGMNIIPVFMPPTWTVLAFFVARYHLFILFVVLLGAALTTLGRVILANISKNYFRRILPEDSQENYESLGKFLDTHENVTIPIVVVYAFLPIPSNDVFIAAGLAEMDIKLLSASFFIGRIIGDTFWVSLARSFQRNLSEVFNSQYSNIGVIAFEIIGLLIVYLIGKVSWKKVLKKISE